MIGKDSAVKETVFQEIFFDISKYTPKEKIKKKAGALSPSTAIRMKIIDKLINAFLYFLR